MRQATVPVPPVERPAPWEASNQRVLEARMDVLRLRLLQRVRALRSAWAGDPLHPESAQVVSDAEADRLLHPPPQPAHGPEDAAIVRRIEEAQRREGALRQALRDAGRPAAPDVLTERFGLTPFEQEVVMLCLAPELDRGLARLYAYVQDDAQRTHPSPELALALLTDAPGAGWHAFLASAPLRRNALLAADSSASPAPPLAATPLRLEERVAAFLRGVPSMDARAAALLRPVPWAPLAPAHDAIVADLARQFAATPHDAPLPMVALLGPPAAGHAAVARGLAQRLGLGLATLDLAALPPAGAEREDALRRIGREAALSDLAILAELPEHPAPGAEPASETVQDLPGLVVASSRQPWPARRPVAWREVPALDAQGRIALWRQALGPDAPALEADLGLLAQQFPLGPAQVAQAVAAARGAGPEGALGPAALWEACRTLGGSRLDGLAQVVEGSHGWDDLVLPEDVLAQLRELAAQVCWRSRVYGEWGFGRKLARGQGIAALFAGPSGTGKTLAAEVMAHELDLSLFRINLANMVSKYIGETEKNLQRVFEAAEGSGAVLFFDEADALFGKRTEVRDSHDRYANLEVDYLLQRMEQYQGIAILATNRKASMDRAFLRRLRFLVDFPAPGPQERRRIWQVMLPAEAPCEALDLDALARLEVTGGNIRTITLNAAFLAAQEGSRLGMRHLLHAARREYAKLDRAVTEAEFGRTSPAPARPVRREHAPG